ncbi:MAG: ArsA family ATPase [Chloroflexota bacterium]
MSTFDPAGSAGTTPTSSGPTLAAGVDSLAELFVRHPERRYVMFGGKGGLGKTTFSAATAFWLAQQGKKVLVFSVDPQASLSDIFQQDIFGKGPVKIMDNLWAQEIDADSHIKAYQDEIRHKILDMYGLEEVPQEIEDYIQAASAEPAMEESAIFDSVVDIVVQGDYDYYIYDLVPLGHALYYLSMAKVYDEWIGKITRLREEMREYEEVAARMRRQKEVDEDQILSELQYIRGRINSASRILTDRERTAFFFVVVPEPMILLDTRKAAELFAKFDVPIGGYVVNRVLPAELAREANVPAYLRHRMELQGEQLEEIRRTFGNEVLAYVPELERDVTGLPMIERLAGIMYAGVTLKTGGAR